MCCANVGMKVTILDIDQKNLDRGMALIDANYARSRSMSAEQKAAARANFTPTINYDDLAHCDMIVEAVFESLDIKQKISEKKKEIDQYETNKSFFVANKNNNSIKNQIDNKIKKLITETEQLEKELKHLKKL